MRRRIPRDSVGRCLRAQLRGTSVSQFPPLRMIGVVDRVFPNRGYGFVQAATPPVSLLASLTSPAGASATDGAKSILSSQHRETPARRDPTSVRFPLHSTGSHADKAQVLPERDMPSPSTGTYVSFFATCHYDAARQMFMWRTRELTPCDAENELRVALRSVRDARWDHVVLQDVEKEKRRIVWKSSVGMLQLTDANCASVNDGRDNYRSSQVEDAGAEQLQAQLAQEKIHRRLHRLSEATRRFFVREEDLRHPLLWMRGCTENEPSAGEDEASTRPVHARENRKGRWKRVMHLLEADNSV
ncbi:hypothetical protein DQ04_01611150 [Trypanosoma grayi]|uniref:hypothetical protein n=1 Tax=Trypanosoma grayi TaxID=71804 RepID=UPI0004F4675F|nr:hypothetical protein DQ04_01611150 [Trypanosoma grayi]KEG12573.1 hypothetical protein DQ04_01611150 [Trypanosoma grayi]